MLVITEDNLMPSPSTSPMVYCQSDVIEINNDDLYIYLIDSVDILPGWASILAERLSLTSTLILGATVWEHSVKEENVVTSNWLKSEEIDYFLESYDKKEPVIIISLLLDYENEMVKFELCEFKHFPLQDKAIAYFRNRIIDDLLLTL